MSFTKARRVLETQTLKRFEGYAERERMPWMCNPRSLKSLELLEQKRVLKVPVSWVPVFELSEGSPGKV